MKQKPYSKWLIGSLLVLLLSLPVIKLWRIGTIARSLYSAYTQIQTITAHPGSVDILQIPPIVHQSRLDLAALQKELRPFYGLMRRLDWLPNIGPDVAAAPDLLDLALSMSETGDIALTALKPALPLIAAGENSSGSQEIISALLKALAPSTPPAGQSQSAPDFEGARQSFARAVAHRADIDAATLSPRLAKWIKRFDQATPLLQLALDFAPLAPQLLGADAPRTYLIIAQNNDELRPTGGFISSLGTLTLEQGQITGLTFEDSYRLDDFTKLYPEAPPQLLRYMLAYLWVFRDANWSPDYPTAVSDMLDLYRISRDRQIDGVIAVDQLALQKIASALEPISVSGWSEPLTGQNVIHLIRQSWSPDSAADESFSEWLQKRKNFMGELVAAMRQRVEKSPASVDWSKLIAASLYILDARHVQIWLADEESRSLIASRAWDGAIRATEGDYLLAIDANLGFNKVNAVVETRLSYLLELTPGQNSTAVLTITHQNNSKGDSPCGHDPLYGKDYEAIINRCYWNYLRIYTPAGSQLLKATPHAIDAEYLISGRAEPARVVELPPEAGKSVWGTFMLIPRGETLETSFYYTLPPSISKKTDQGWRYRLLWQKQAGTAGHKAQVTVQLPTGSRLIRVNPSPDRMIKNRLLEFDLSLATDQEIEVVFEYSPFPKAD